MVKVTFNNKPAQGKTAPASPNKETGGGVSIAFPNGIKKKGSIQTTPYQKALDEAILKASAADRRATSPMFRQQENAVMPDVQSAIMRGLMQDALQQQNAKKYQSPEAMKKAAEESKKQTLGERVGNTLKGAAETYGAGLVNIAGERQIGANMQQRADMEKEIALWDQDIAAQKSVLSDPSATESERETARTVIETLEARKAAYRQAYNEGGVADQAANEIYKAADKMADSGARNIEKAKSGLGKVGQIAVDVGVAGAQMGADAAASALTGGVALIPMFIRGAGSSAQEARRQGATHEQQVRYGTLSGMLSVATEKIGNAATPFKKMFGKGFLDNVIERSVKGLNNSAAGKLVLSFLEEGGEEVLEDLVQPALQTIYNGKTVGGSYSELEAAEVLNDFLVGGILGGLGGSVDAIRNRGYYDSHTELPKVEGTKSSTGETPEMTTPSPEATTPETTAPTAEETTPTAQRPVEQQPGQQQNTTPAQTAEQQNAVPTQATEQQNTAPAQPAPTPESTPGMGEGNLTPTQPNAAQGTAEGKTDALDAGKRGALDKYTTPENEDNGLTVMQGIADTIGVSDATRVWEFAKNNKDELVEKALGGVCSAYENEARAEGDIDFAPAINDINLFYSIDTFDTLTDRFEEEYIKKYNEVPSAAEKAALLMVAVQESVNEGYIAQSSNGWYTLTDKGMHKVYDDIGGIEDYILDRRSEMLDGKLEYYSSLDWGNAEVTDMRDSRKGKLPPKENAVAEIGSGKLIYDMPEGQNGGIDNAGQEARNDAAGAELADAAERGAPGEADAARALSNGAAERGERGSNGRESERIPREVRNVGGEDGNALTVQRRQEASGISQFISPREANVPNGASGDNTVTIFDEADWDQELISAANWAKSKGVKKVTALLGIIKVEKDGKTARIFGAFNADTGEIFVNAGSVQRSVSETIEHETAHYLAEVARRENVRTFMRDVQSRYSSEEWGKVYDAYFDRYAALTGDYAGMSESDIELYVWEEIMGDAYAEIDQYDEKASRFNREAENALSQSGQESESALQSERAPSAAEQGRETAAATERRTGPPEKYSVEETDDGRAVAVVDDDILSGIDTQTWDKTKKAQAKAAAKTALLTFKDGIQVNGIDYKVSKRSRDEFTRSNETEKLYRKNKDAFADKMRAAANADDIITAATDWAKDGGLTHPRTGNLVDFAHGDVLIQSGNNQYDAKVVVGITDGGEYVFYDVVDMEPTSFAKKEETPTAASSGEALSAIHGVSSDNNISGRGENVKSPTLGDEIRRQMQGEDIGGAAKKDAVQELPQGATGSGSLADATSTASDGSVSNGGGNVKPKTRFSLDEPVEETKTLVAMHNMTEEKLRRTLDIGAWPAPSIAIVKAKDGHTNYGEYSAVFPRETIDPQRSGKNKVYGGDAWTPTRSNARVEYEVDQSRARALEREIDRLSSEFAGGAFRNSSVIGAAGVNEETELSLDDIAERLAKYPAVQAAYLQSKGESLEPVYKEKQFDSLGNNVLRQYVDRVGMQEVARLYAEIETGGRLDESALNAAREVIVDDWAKRNARLLERRAENRDKLIAVQKNRLEDWRVEKFIRNAEEYIEQSGASGDEVDKEATSAKMYSMIAPGGSWGDVEKTVQQWVRPRLDGMLGKPGIYNGKDPYTENGRKPFKETHWDYTAENIVRAMNNASDRGEGMWGLTGGTLTATSVPQYESVDAIHADEERLRAESDDVHEKRLRDLDIEIDHVVDDLLRSTKAHSDSEYEERHILEDVLAEAAKGEHSPAAIKRSFAKDGYAIKDGNARSIMRLFDIAAKIPAGYFEAKPQRVVGFDEALAVVAPDDAPSDLLNEMRGAGMNVVEYRAGDDADRLAKINSIKNVRFSAEDEGGELTEQQEQSYEKAERDGKRGDYRSIPAEWKTKLERARTAATNNIKPSGFDSYDAYLDALDKQRAADRAERLRVKSRDEFKGTKALDELGVKIANSAGIYHNTEQLIANDRAAKSIQRATERAEQRLGATRQEKTIARDIANGERSMSDIPRGVKKSRVLELADYYTAQKATKTGLLQQQRIEINDALREQARELIGTEAPEINRKGLRKLFDPSKGLVLYHRTPQRIMRALFGWEQGQKINEAVFEPVYENEQERKRFINRMFDEVRTFEGADGKKSALNKDESAFAQRLKEGRTVEELVEKSGAAESIRAAAENLKNGAEIKDAAREFSLDKDSRDLARQYADWLQTQDDYAAAKNVDRTKVENAIEKYTELYDKLYAAINDFLVAHGYEPIGFIKGYAPHFQTSEANGKLESALKAIGVDLGSGVGKLPTSIAGLTKSFKPNKRYNPFFRHRRGNETDYDIVKGFETYVDYASDVLYHTDDIMRVRQMANYLRSTFAPEEMKTDIDQMEAMRYAPADVKEEYLRDKGEITGDTVLSYEDLTGLMERYTDEKYRSIADATEFSDLVSWMDDYANKLAGKQLFEDRAMEREVGREALNGAKKLNRMFARANVAGNLSSALNQTAQLPMIATELGQKYTWRAVGDILNGKTTGMSAFRGESDFLTEKSGIDYIQSTKGEKALEKLFSPLEKVDTLVSTIAVRGKYRMELDAGKSPKEAMKAADRWARDIMGTRSKGSVPLTFQSKSLVAQMLNMFQVEAANTFEHVTQDRLGPGFKEMAAKIGKDKAIKKLASDAIAYMLLAFLLNRLDEDAYGGTPAPFDVLGMGLNAAASANGLTSSDMLKMITDDVTENLFGERLFDTDPNDMNDELDLWSAAEDTLYNISNDVPYVRNVAGLLGLGDETLPMPDLWGTATGIGKTLKKQATGKFDSPGDFWSEVGRQLMGLAGDTLPGGRQLEKSAQGIEALVRGGSYQGAGDSKKLQYPVEPLLEDPFEALRAALFGKNALSESRAYWAAGGNALSASQTALYQELVDSGMSRKKAYETIRDFNDATAGLEADKDKNGKNVNGSLKEKVIKEINKLPLSRKQKDKLYLSKNYSEKDLGDLPWN